MTVNILLPKAEIALFTEDQATLDAAQNIQQDWRFARIKWDMQQGGLDQAASMYQEKKSPDLLIVQTAKVDEAFLASLEKLATLCAAETDCLIIGPENDVQLYRKLTGLGIRDYMVAPLSAQDLLETAGKALLEKYGQQDSEIITVIGSRGGCGTSTIAQMLAEGLSALAHQKTLLMDLCGSWSSFPVWLGYEPNTSTAELATAAAKSDMDALQRMVIQLDDNLSVLASGTDNALTSENKAEAYDKIINILLPRHPYLIIDTSFADSATRELAVKRASKILLVTEPHIGGLRQCKNLIKDIKALRGLDDLSLIVNKKGLNPDGEVSESDLKAALGLSPIWQNTWDAKGIALRDMQDKRFRQLENGAYKLQDLLHKIYPDLIDAPSEKKGFLSWLK